MIALESSVCATLAGEDKEQQQPRWAHTLLFLGGIKIACTFFFIIFLAATIFVKDFYKKKL